MRSNNTPFTDLCTLVAQTTTTDADGYPAIAETSRQIFCNVCDGVTRTEFYEAYKAGIQLTATVEINQGDYNGERILEHGGKRYNIVRTYPTGYGTLECSCQEDVR